VSEASSIAAAALRPFWGRVTVSESPVDEEQRESGLVVPHRHEGDDGIIRGIVLHCSERSALGLTCDAADHLLPGTVVYYPKAAALRIAGVVILHHADVLAYEDGDL
jgi:co-chaperonin GroES (HSP10)